MAVPIQFALSSNDGKFGAANGERLVNLYAEAMPPNSKVPVVLYGTPGQYRFAMLPDGPVQGLEIMDGILYAVTCRKFYQVGWDGGYTELGDVIINGPVSMSTNGFQVVFVDGTKGYAYDPTTTPGLQELYGDGWYPANTVTHQDGYFIFNRSTTGQFFFTELLSVEFDALDYATAEAAPDDTLALISDQRALWLFGEMSTEIWYNDGTTPWARMHGAYIEKGIAAPFSAKKADNGIFWLGSDRVVYRTNGYGLNRVSTHAVEYDLSKAMVSDAVAYSYTQEGHVFYVLTIPSINKTWCFDVTTGLWHERSHTVHGRHNGQCYADCYGRHLIGDYQSGAIYALDMAALTDGGDRIIRTAISPALSAKGNRATMYGVEIELQPGVGNAQAPGNDPVVVLQYSDDGQKSWSERKVRKIGRVGEFKRRAKWGPLGQFTNRHIKIEISDPVPVVVVGAYADIESNQ